MKKIRQRLLKFPHKRLRAEVIFDYCRRAGINNIVVFSCGNASRWLKRICKNKIYVETPISDKWYSMEEIADMWSEFFDATTGHLPFWLMARLAKKFRAYFKEERGGLPVGTYYVPTGSGETIWTLRLAYPKHTFIAVYNVSRGSKYEPGEPLNQLVSKHFQTNYGYPRR